MLMRMWSNWNSHTFVVGAQNVTIILENCLPVSYKGKHISILKPSNYYPRYLCKRYKNLYSQKDCKRTFIAGLYRIGKKGESTQISSNRGMDKQIMMYGTNYDV